jgi:hypothetical protein
MRIFRAMASTGAMVSAITAGIVLLSSGAAVAAPGQAGAVASPSPAGLSASQIGQLEAEAAASVRMGWFVPVQCRCSFVSEAAFQKIMNGIFDIAAALNHKSTRSTPNTAMRVKSTDPKRIPDIYYFKLNAAHPAKGAGSINEFKVGTSALGSLGFQSGADADMLKQGHGVGANADTRGRFLPVTGAFWWFVPKNGVTYSNFKFINTLLQRGINVIYVEDNRKAPAWPRAQGNKRKADDIAEIQTNDVSRAQAGLNDMIGPCLDICPVF